LTSDPWFPGGKINRSGSYYAERRFESFTRSLRLPFDVSYEKVDAKFKDGVLTIHLPKPAQLQKSVRKIEVKTR
jgi:HSP20 family protein